MNNNIIVKEVTTKKEMKRFVQFPLDLYRDNKNYIPLFFNDEMKLFDKKKSVYAADSVSRFFVCYKDGAVAGRVAGLIVKPYIKKTGRKVLRFSRIDFIDDENVSKALFDAIKAMAKEEGLDEIQGPMGYNDLDREGLLLEGFNIPSTFGSAYSAEYYPRHIEANGFTKEVDWLEFKLFLPSDPNEKYSRIAAMVAKRYNLREVAVAGVKVKDILDKYSAKIFDMINEAYAGLHGTIPLEGKFVDEVRTQFKLFLIPEFFSVVVNENDAVVGFGLALSSIIEELVRCRGKITPLSIIRLLKLKNNPKTAELGLIAVAPEYQKRGVNAMIVDKILRGMIAKNIKEVETNLELEHNTSVISMWEGVDKEFIKRRRCYIIKTQD